MRSATERIARSLETLYHGEAPELFDRLIAAVERSFPDWKSRSKSASDRVGRRFSQRDAILISYPDMLRGKGPPPLETLADFAEHRLAGLFSHIHVLPFFPSSSDEGFSVTDYRAVDGAMGTWESIGRLRRRFSLVFDLVLNHASAQSEWFRAFLEGRAPFDRYFVTRPQGYDARAVFRPRTHPLLTGFRRPDGSTVQVWTTFSADQADLDYSRPEVLLEMADVFLSYLSRGARILRLDAIAYVWKEDGTPCVDLPGAHAIVKLLRALVDLAAPDASLLTETNLPHEANISYFGSDDEANLVYNFALPPLVLHAFLSGRADFLASWAARLPEPAEDRVFVNFLASHDGIGLTPARGIIPEEELRRVVEEVAARGGLVSARAAPEGPVPYELNATFLDAVADPAAAPEDRAGVLLACHAVMLALAGLPAVYFHSLVGSGNWKEGPRVAGSARAINRERLALGELERELDDPAALRHAVFHGLARLLRERAKRPAFDPSAVQRVLEPDGSGGIVSVSPGAAPLSRGPIFGLVRGRGPSATLALVNVAARPATCVMPRDFWPGGEGLGTRDEAPPTIRGREVALPPRSGAWIDGSYEGG